MSTRLQQTFQQGKEKNSPVFVAFTTAGYPTVDSTVPILLGLQEGGANVIELGIPHSDPIADGPTIQASSTLALQNGVTVKKCFELLKEARTRGLTVPVVLMGYCNPFYAYGVSKLCQDAKEAGADGYIVVDLPPEESVLFRNECANHQLSFVPLVAPNTSNKRLEYINSVLDDHSFVYCVSLLGVTGGRTELPKELPQFIHRVKKHIQKPLAIGFGISSRDQLLEVSHLGNGVVVGSAIIKALGAAHANHQGETSAIAAAAKTIALHFTTPQENELPRDQQNAAIHENDNDHHQDAVHHPERLRLPDSFGDFGGRYAPETLMGALEELEHAYATLKDDPNFQEEVRSFYDYVGRPTPIYCCERLSAHLGGCKIWLKREDLSHTGAHKINNAIGQALIAKRLGKTRIIAETGAGQHGVATATICAKLGLECIVYMGAEDIQRQSLNVFRMKMLGATVIPVTSGSRTLKDAINEAMRDWVTNIQFTHYLVGSAIGPHPFPTIVRDFQSVIGREARGQMIARTGRLPDVVMACVGGGSNAIGMFHPFIQDEGVQLVGVEAAGSGMHTDKHCATLAKGKPGVLHGTRTYILQDEDGQIAETHSVSAGLDYPGVGPEHAHLHASGRAKYVAVSDSEALEGFKMLTRMEGIIPALETSHAIYEATRLAPTLKPEQNLIICLSGRGDKDMGTVAKELNITL